MKYLTREKIIVWTTGMLGKILKVDAVTLTQHYLFGYYSDSSFVGRFVKVFTTNVAKVKGIPPVQITKP